MVTWIEAFIEVSADGLVLFQITLTIHSTVVVLLQFIYFFAHNLK